MGNVKVVIRNFQINPEIQNLKSRFEVPGSVMATPEILVLLLEVRILPG